MSPNVDKSPPTDINPAIIAGRSTAETIGEPGADSPERPMPNEALPLGASAQQQASSALSDPAAIAVPAQQHMASHRALASPQVATPQQSDEDDMSIERECISKAKSIVERTSTDPFIQTQEIGKVKAELLKRRYGKEFKIDER